MELNMVPSATRPTIHIESVLADMQNEVRSSAEVR